MTKIFIFANFGLNIHNSFLYFFIILAALLKENSKTNMTKKSW